MPTIVDSYSVIENTEGVIQVHSLASQYVGQSFTGDGGTIDNVKFNLLRQGIVTGNCRVKIFAETHATAFGTDSLPTGSVLATSDEKSVNDLPTSHNWVTFTFSGSNKIVLENGIKYVVVYEYLLGDSSNRTFIYLDNPNGSHPGNSCAKLATSPYTLLYLAYDLLFYVYKDDIVLPSSITGLSTITGIQTITF